MNPSLVEVLRGSHIESRHAGALAIVDADGQLVCGLGDVSRPVFPRSAVKALQALPLVESGAAERFGYGDAELAIACASHSGEPAHVARSAAMLQALGLDENALECGSQWPGREPVLRGMLLRGEQAGPLHNNCSGKHAGFVCLGCQLALQAGHEPAEFVRGYIGPDHAVMREVTAALAAMTGCDLSDAPRGTDGCSIPTFAIPLQDLAWGFARLGSGQGLPPERARAARRLRQAVAAQPFYVAGTDRFDTRVMALLGERLFCKVGAEGVYCAALPELGLGVAIKIDDGTVRAVEVAMAAVVEALLALDAPAGQLIDSLARPLLRNWRGTEVGALRPAPALVQALAGFRPA